MEKKVKKDKEHQKVVTIELECLSHGKDIFMDWFTKKTDYFFLENFAKDEKGEIKYLSNDIYKIEFVPNEGWPKSLERQKEEAQIFLENLDEDGNYLVNGDEFVETKVLKVLN